MSNISIIRSSFPIRTSVSIKSGKLKQVNNSVCFETAKKKKDSEKKSLEMQALAELLDEAGLID